LAYHDYGDEAKGLVDSGRQTGANVGETGVNVVTGTSLVWHAGEMGVGMVGKEEEGEKGKVVEEGKGRLERLDSVDLNN